MKRQKPKENQPGAAPKPLEDWLKKKQLRQKKTPVFQRGPVSKVQFHGTQHRG